MTAEAPVLNDKPFPSLDSETAARLGRLGGLATKNKKRAEKERLEPSPPDIRVLRARMTKIEKLMNADPTSKVWDELTRSYERLFKIWQVLAGLPGPGQRRPGPERTTRRRGSVARERVSPQVESVVHEDATPESGTILGTSEP